jgi:hypothetical protein
MDVEEMARVMGAKHMTMDLDNFTNYLFLENEGLAYLDIQGLENTKDMFCFCLDLFCKGLVILYGNEEKRVYVEMMTYDQFLVVATKMKRAGILVHMSLDPVEDGSETIEERRRHLSETTSGLQNMSPQLPLKEYIFELKTIQHVIRISFELIRH